MPGLQATSGQLPSGVVPVWRRARLLQGARFASSVVAFEFTHLLGSRRRGYRRLDLR